MIFLASLMSVSYTHLFVQDLNRRMKIPMILVRSVLVLPVAAESKHMLTPPRVLKTDNYVSGIVKDINGEPLFGVNVSVKGSTTGTITDEEGAYSFANLNPKAVSYTHLIRTAANRLSEICMLGKSVSFRK